MTAFVSKFLPPQLEKSSYAYGNRGKRRAPPGAHIGFSEGGGTNRRRGPTIFQGSRFVYTAKRAFHVAKGTYHTALATGGSSAQRTVWGGGGGGKFLPSGPNLPPFSAFFTDLGHLVLKLLNFNIYSTFIFYICYLVIWVAQTGHYAFGEGNGPQYPPPWIRQWPWQPN